MAEELPAARYARDELGKSGGRKARDMDNMSTERRTRLYVNPYTGVTATAVGDNANPPNPN
jgi:hypothetical protein